MRREDKRRLPPRLIVSLPPGYHLETVPDGYRLYVTYPFGAGHMTDLVCGFTADSTLEEIAAVAREPIAEVEAACHRMKNVFGRCSTGA